MISETQLRVSADGTGRFNLQANHHSLSVLARNGLRRAPVTVCGWLLHQFKIAEPVFLFGTGIESGEEYHAVGEWLAFRGECRIVRVENHIIDQQVARGSLCGIPGEDFEVVHALAIAKRLGAAVVAPGIAREVDVQLRPLALSCLL